MAPREIEIDFPIMRYDIMLPLLEGRVAMDGVRLRPVEVSSGPRGGGASNLASGDFGLCDLNLSFFLPAIEAGWELIGLPIFPKRKPVYTYAFCRTDASIATPKDLEGKRIGAGGRYSTIIGTWLRGLLHDHYGVDNAKLHWLVWGDDAFPARTPCAASVEAAPNLQKSPVDALFDDEIDALMWDPVDLKLWETLEHSPLVKRLFPNYKDEDERLYRQTGIFTPVHIMVMSKKLDAQYPDLAARLYEAFNRSKELATEDQLTDLRGMGLMYLRERKQEEIDRWGDLWKYGVRANQSAIDTFIRYSHKEGIISAKPSYNQLFAAGTLDT